MSANQDDTIPAGDAQDAAPLDTSTLVCGGCGQPLVAVGIKVTSAEWVERTYGGPEFDPTDERNRGNVSFFDTEYHCGGCGVFLDPDLVEALLSDGYL